MSFDKNSIYALLNSKNIQFSYTEHRPVYSMEESDTLKIPAGAVICKNLFLRNNNGKQHFLLTIPADTPVDLKELAVKLNHISAYSEKSNYEQARERLSALNEGTFIDIP